MKKEIQVPKKQRILAETRWESTLIDVDDIIYLERSLRKITIHTEDESIEYYENLKNVEPLLDDRFFEVICGVFVNLEEIKQVKNGVVKLSTGEELVFPSRSYAKLKQRHSSYHKTKQLEKVGLRRASSNTDSQFPPDAPDSKEG